MKFLPAITLAVTVAFFAASDAQACPGMKNVSSGTSILAEILPGGPQSQPVTLPTTKKPASGNS